MNMLAKPKDWHRHQASKGTHWGRGWRQPTRWIAINGPSSHLASCHQVWLPVIHKMTGLPGVCPSCLVTDLPHQQEGPSSHVVGAVQPGE